MKKINKNRMLGIVFIVFLLILWASLVLFIYNPKASLLIFIFFLVLIEGILGLSLIRTSKVFSEKWKERGW